MTASKIYKGGGFGSRSGSGSGSRSGSGSAARGLAFGTMALDGRSPGYTSGHGTSSGSRSNTEPKEFNHCKEVGRDYVRCVYDVNALTPGQIIYIIHNSQDNQEKTKYHLDTHLETSTEVTYTSIETVDGVTKLNYNTTNKGEDVSVETSKITTSETDIKQYSIYIDCPYGEKQNFNYPETYGKNFIAIRDPTQFRRGDKIYILNNTDKLKLYYNLPITPESVNWGRIVRYTFHSYDAAEGLKAFADNNNYGEWIEHQDTPTVFSNNELTTDNAQSNIKKYSLYVDTLRQKIKTFNDCVYGDGKFKQLMQDKKVAIRLPMTPRSRFSLNAPQFNLNKGDILYIVRNVKNNSLNPFNPKYKEDPDFKLCNKMQFFGLNERDNTYMFSHLGQNLWNSEQYLIKLDPSEITTDNNNLKQYTLYVDRHDEQGTSRDTPMPAKSGGKRPRKRGSRRPKSKKSRKTRKSRR